MGGRHHHVYHFILWSFEQHKPPSLQIPQNKQGWILLGTADFQSLGSKLYSSYGDVGDRVEEFSGWGVKSPCVGYGGERAWSYRWAPKTAPVWDGKTGKMPIGDRGIFLSPGQSPLENHQLWHFFPQSFQNWSWPHPISLPTETVFLQRGCSSKVCSAGFCTTEGSRLQLASEVPTFQNSLSCLIYVPRRCWLPGGIFRKLNPWEYLQDRSREEA